MTAFRLVSSGWADEIEEASKEESSHFRIVCPFIKLKTAQRFLKRNCGKIEVITRFDLRGFDQGVSDIEALRALLDAGARIRGVKGLHAKLYQFGTSRVICSSANLTETAMYRNHEFGFVSSSSDIVAKCSEYIDGLWAKAKPDLQAWQLDEWEAKLTKHRSGNPKLNWSALDDYGANVGESSDDQLPLADGISARSAFLKFSGSSIDRAFRSARIDDTVISGTNHWAACYPATKPPRQVVDGDIIYMGRLVRDPNDVMIFGWAIGRMHHDDLDIATAEEIADRPWKTQWPRYVRVHDCNYVDGTLGDGIPLSKMMDAFGADTFSSTQQNMLDGTGNTDPARAIMQKAHMKLTVESAEWLYRKLAERILHAGKINVFDSRFSYPDPMV